MAPEESATIVTEALARDERHSHGCDAVTCVIESAGECKQADAIRPFVEAIYAEQNKTDDARNEIADILFAAYRFDDKPHQLFSAIRRVALKFADPAERDEIVRLMDAEHERPRNGGAS